MALEVNGARGEVALKVGDVDLVVAATISGLAKLSTRLESRSMGDLFEKLANVEVNTVIAGLELLTVRGDAKAAVAALRLGHFPAIAKAFSEALAHHFGDEPGNGEAAKETTEV